MEIIECQKGEQQGWKCGDNGTCYIGADAKQRALQERGKLLGKQYTEEPKASTVEFLEKHEKRVAKEKESLAKLEQAIENNEIDKLDVSDFDPKGLAFKKAQIEKENFEKAKKPKQAPNQE